LGRGSIGEREAHHLFEIGLTLLRHPATEAIDTLQQGFRLRGMPGIGGSRCAVHQIISVVLMEGTSGSE